jgi:hypothetical protein
MAGGSFLPDQDLAGPLACAGLVAALGAVWAVEVMAPVMGIWCLPQLLVCGAALLGASA